MGRFIVVTAAKAERDGKKITYTEHDHVLIAHADIYGASETDRITTLHYDAGGPNHTKKRSIVVTQSCEELFKLIRAAEKGWD